jgi:preprotein translocase subunit YajC
MFSLLFLAASQAFAQAAAGGAPAKPNLFESLIPFVIMFGVVYFLMLRPQSKQRKDHAKFVAELKRGEIVVTAGGIIGKIDNITDKFVTLEVEDGSKMKVIRTYILSPVRAEEPKSQQESKK